MIFLFLLAVGIFRACIEIHPDENSTIYSSFQKTLSLRKFNTIARLFSLPCHNVDSKEREKKKLFRCLRSFWYYWTRLLQCSCFHLCTLKDIHGKRRYGPRLRKRGIGILRATSVSENPKKFIMKILKNCKIVNFERVMNE